ncbi:MAG: hypothetical protein PHX72_02205 [Candidatus Shapirobacteria bacterium]|nr:hypothetical protein [Candidatus Shapirobacteria bacterium]
MERLINWKKQGQSLVEVVVAVSITALIIVALLIGAVIGIRNVQFSRNQSQAMELNREVAEWLRTEKKIGWSQLFSNGSPSGESYCFNFLNFNNQGNCTESELIDEKFVREGVLRQEDEDKLEITVITSWRDPAGQHSETISTYLTKY